MKIDTTFVEKLLPNQNNYYSWLRVVMDKWEKSHPGTMEVLFKMTDRKKFWKKIIPISTISVIIISLILFFVMVIIENPTGIIVLFCILVISLLIFFMNIVSSDDLLPVKKDDRLQKLLVLLDEIEEIFCKYNERSKRSTSFEVLKSHSENKAFELAEHVLDCERQLDVYSGGKILAEALENARLTLNNFHRLFVSGGLLERDLGKYYKKEVPKSELVGMEQD